MKFICPLVAVEDMDRAHKFYEEDITVEGNFRWSL
ncbi:hypothetical protein SAMN05216323_102240 [Williamwhitmania taraxaci]|uniref:Uncharacterized protein n=1 Tax=Williamwhitmania taraxaci TaxID=1640674 RepID=A0A1G6K0J7_9BACT|nr:hypothetical protein SAMN05216323_102240 [Williamwhitmania taraxaci]